MINSGLFHFDEDKFANKLLSFLSSKDGITIPDYERNFNKKQANGHSIKKFQGHIVVDNFAVGFEFQIKSSIHNLWGEVEHRLIYKPTTFDFRIIEKEQVVGNIWTNLTSTDNQLQLLYKEEYKKRELLKQLFSMYVTEKVDITPINSHYLFNLFFEIFTVNKDDILEKILSEILLGPKSVQKHVFEIEFSNREDLKNRIRDKLDKLLLDTELEQLENLFNFCFNATDQIEFKDILVHQIIYEYIPTDEKSKEIDILSFDYYYDYYNDDNNDYYNDDYYYDRYNRAISTIVDNSPTNEELSQKLKEIGFKIERISEYNDRNY